MGVGEIDPLGCLLCWGEGGEGEGFRALGFELGHPRKQRYRLTRRPALDGGSRAAYSHSSVEVKDPSGTIRQ